MSAGTGEWSMIPRMPAYRAANDDGVDDAPGGFNPRVHGREVAAVADMGLKTVDVPNCRVVEVVVVVVVADRLLGDDGYELVESGTPPM